MPLSISPLAHRLSRPVDAASLGLFRVLWGLTMCLEARWVQGQLTQLHDPGSFHFAFPGFSWIRHFPSAWMMEIETAAMMVGAIGIALGICTRPAIALFLATFAHFFFAEAAAYNNHFYLIVLVNFLLLFCDSDRCFSLRRWRVGNSPVLPDSIPVWQLHILRAQVFIVYFYGAISKLSRDWLIEMEPVRFWLHHTPKAPEWLVPLLRQPWFTPLTAWGGLFIDLVCPFLLLHRRTRYFAIGVLTLFHLANSQIFNIGYFPIMGMVLLLPFLPPDLMKRRTRETSATVADAPAAPLSRFVTGLLVAYFLFQILFPLRWHLWRPANPLWTEKGQEFAWRMMLQEQISSLELRFADPEVQALVERRPDVLPPLSPALRRALDSHPHFVWQYVQELRRNLEPFGKEDAAIHAFVASSLNGRAYTPLIDPNIDLAKAKYPLWRVPDWILPTPTGPIDFEAIKPFQDYHRFADEALRRWIADHPGPATSILKLYDDQPQSRPSARSGLTR